MADFDELHRVIHSIASGFEEECIRCMEEHKNVLVDCIQEQLYSGLDGTEHLLNPDYDTDTYFNEPGPWQNRAEQYKRWKERITPPLRSEMLYLPPRPVEVPNLRGFGSFVVKKRAQKTARNISKNTTIIIPEHNIPAFKPAKTFTISVKK